MSAFSLYPSVCIHNTFPCGSGLHLKGPKMTSRLFLDYEKGVFRYHNPHNNTKKEIDGILQIIIGIEPHLHELNSLPFLPIRYGPEGRTFRASCYKCLVDQKKSLCKHSISQRRWRETYNAREVAYAVTRLKYTLFCIEEALIYDDLQPLCKDFMQLMSSKKIRSSQVPPSFKSDLNTYCKTINEKMEFSNPSDVLSPDLIVPNEYECSFIKSLMNIVVGKLSQSQMHSSVEFIRHEDRVSELFSDPSLDIKTCFGVSDGCLQITYQKKGESLRPSRCSQMCINASVTSLARIKLDQSLRLLQENQCSLIYTDTDSVVFRCPKNVDPATILELHPSK